MILSTFSQLVKRNLASIKVNVFIPGRQVVVVQYVAFYERYYQLAMWKLLESSMLSQGATEILNNKL